MPTINIARRLALLVASLTAALVVLIAMTAIDARAAFWDNTDVSFRNSYGKTVSVAIIKQDDICGWATKAWYEVKPGEVKRIFSTTARYAYYYAQADDGAEWTGSSGPWQVFDNVMNDCLYIGTRPGGRMVKWVQVDTKGRSSMTLNLIP